MTAITENILIGELIEQYPEVIEPLQEYGIHCVGCHVSPFESLGDGLRGHGMAEPEIVEILKKLNSLIQPKNEAAAFQITEQAAQKIRSFCQAENKPALRLTVQSGGCSGNKYVFELSDKKETDVLLEKDGAALVIDKGSLQKINGSTLDYKEGLTDAGFKVENPQAQAVCGCGKSFR